MPETSLHSSIKDWYTLPGDRLEVKVGNFIIDIVRDDLLVEIQTRNFSAIKKKLKSLVRDHNVRLVYPIPKKKWIVRVAEPNGEVIGRRKSPRKGRLVDLFDELVWMPLLIREPSFTMEVLMIEEEEIRCKDGRGSWRKKGVSTKDRKLLDVFERAKFSEIEDFVRLLPHNLDLPFSNKSLAESAGLSIRQARRITYCLRRMGAIRKVGKRRNELLFDRGCS